MFAVRKFAEVSRHASRSGIHKFSGEIAGGDHQIENRSDRRRGDGRKQSIDYGVEKDPAGILLRSERGECSSHRERDSRNCDKLKEPGVDFGDKVAEIIEPAAAESSENGTADESRHPDDEFFAVEA